MKAFSRVLVVLLCVVLCSACMSAKRINMPPLTQPYLLTMAEAKVISRMFEGYRPVSPLPFWYMLDIPFTVVFDTLFLPADVVYVMTVDTSDAPR